MNIDINMSNFFDVESLYVQVNNFKKVSFVIKKKPKKNHSILLSQFYLYTSGL